MAFVAAGEATCGCKIDRLIKKLLGISIYKHKVHMVGQDMRFYVSPALLIKLSSHGSC